MPVQCNSQKLAASFGPLKHALGRERILLLLLVSFQARKMNHAFFLRMKNPKKKGRKKLREHQMLMKCQLVVEWNSIGNTTYIKVEGCLGNAFKDVFGSLCLIYQPFVYTFSFKHHHETFTLKLLIASPLGNETFHCCLGLLF